MDPGQSIASAVINVADRQPDRLAVRTVDGAVTYAQLAERIGGVARRVRDLPSRAPVGLIAADGLDLVSGALGIWSAGRAVVLVDPRFGSTTVERLVTSTGMSLLLAGGQAQARTDAVEVVGLRQIGSEALVPSRVSETAPAVVTSTSGSSGEPKQRTLTFGLLTAELAIAARSPVAMHDGERVGMLLGTSNLVLKRAAMAVLSSGTISCFDGLTMTTERIVSALARHRVTYLALIPTYLRRFTAATEHNPGIPTLRTLVIGGEPLGWPDVAAARRALSPRCTVVYSYGSAELGMVTAASIGPDRSIEWGTLPVGRPLPGVTVTIRAPDGTIVPDGALGEIVVDTPTAREGASAHVLPDGRHRCRTADVGWLRGDGQLVLAGRSDEMVKIAGVQVLPAEVERVLREIPTITDVKVVVAPDDDSTPGLIAHCASHNRGHLEAQARAHLARSLHPAAAACRYVWHEDALPTLPSGKIDLMALHASAATATTPPSN